MIVVLAGNAVAYRRARRNRVGFAHKVKREESMKWFQQKVCVVSSFPIKYR
jgi:hypothetical protein